MPALAGPHTHVGTASPVMTPVPQCLTNSCLRCLERMMGEPEDQPFRKCSSPLTYLGTKRECHGRERRAYPMSQKPCPRCLPMNGSTWQDLPKSTATISFIVWLPLASPMAHLGLSSISTRAAEKYFKLSVKAMRGKKGDWEKVECDEEILHVDSQ